MFSESKFLENLALLNPFQLNTILNNKNAMLDLVLSNFSSLVVTLSNNPIV